MANARTRTAISVSSSVAQSRHDAYLDVTGALAQTFDRSAGSLTSVSALATARVQAQAIPLVAGMTVTSITFISGTTAASVPLNQWFGLADSSRNVLRLTADDTTTAWSASTAKTLTLTTPYAITTSGLYYLMICVKATTPPSLIGINSIATVTGIAPILDGHGQSGLTDPASLGASMSALAADNGMIYAYVS